MKKLKWLFIASFLVTALYHISKIILAVVGDDSSAPRHGVFVLLIVMVALLLYIDRKILIWPIFFLIMQQIYGQGTYGFKQNFINNIVDWPGLIVLTSMPLLVFYLIVRLRNPALIILLCLFPLGAFAGTSAVWGKIIAVAGRTYVYFESEKVVHAYEIAPTSPEMNKVIKSNLNQFVRIEGSTKEVVMEKDGFKQRLLIFYPTKFKPLNLAELSENLAVNTESTKAFSTKKTLAYKGGGIEISDKAANAMIYAGGAVMLGSLLKNALIK